LAPPTLKCLQKPNRPINVGDFEATGGLASALTELAREMLDTHIHRLFVVQKQGRPIGIVSCTDIMRAGAHTADEGYEGTESHTSPAERPSRAKSIS